MHNVHMKPRRGLRRLASFLAHHIPRPRNARAKSRTGGCSKFGTHSEELEDILSSVDLASASGMSGDHFEDMYTSVDPASGEWKRKMSNIIL